MTPPPFPQNVSLGKIKQGSDSATLQMSQGFFFSFFNLLMEEEDNIVFVFIDPLGEHLKKKKETSRK